MILTFLLALPALPTVLASPTPQNLYEWMGVAPCVVFGTVRVDDQRYVEMEVRQVLVGDVPLDRPLLIDQRNANRDRTPGEPALRLEKGRSYLALLEPAPVHKQGTRPNHLLVRGVAGVRELAAEGATGILSAAERLAQVRLLADDTLRWLAFEQLLEDPNPLLPRTALDLFLKFRRGSVRHVPLLRPLLDHPDPDIRAGSVRLIAQIAQARGGAEVHGEPGLEAEVVGRARRDPVVDVRVAATACVAAFGGTNAERILQEIARDDPEQDVRYAAQRALYERKDRRN